MISIKKSASFAEKGGISLEQKDGRFSVENVLVHVDEC